MICASYFAWSISNPLGKLTASIREAGADEAVLTLKSLEAFARAADGKATKIIIPSDIQGIAGLASSLKEIVTDPKAETDK